MTGALALALLAELGDDDFAALASRLRPYLDYPERNRLLSPAEAGARLGVHPKTLTRAAAAGRVPNAVRVGRAWRFRADGLALEPPASMSIAPIALRQARRSPSHDATNAIRNGGGKRP